MDFEKVNGLIPFYENLLTERQREIIKFYYYEDLSLAEIAENLEISRNAVYDTIRKTAQILDRYEEQLHLKRDYETREAAYQKLLEHVDDEGRKILQELINREEEE